LKTIAEVRQWTKERKLQGQRIGFVPTMGYLHEGHLSLAQVAVEENEAVIMSIFVNPLQFGPKEDFATYPKDLERDCALAASAGVDAVFAPEVSEMYPYYPQLTTVQVAGVTEGLCGASRPGHFTGVTTVVMKLFNIVQADTAYFGQKDYQQVRVIRQMTADLNLPVEIKTVPIKREADGLAMSSRNTYLSTDERRQALSLSQALALCEELYDRGERDSARLIEAIRRRIGKEPAAAVDYIEVCDQDTLQPVEYVAKPVVVALAVRIGKTRLIDNIELGGVGLCSDT